MTDKDRDEAVSIRFQIRVFFKYRDGFTHANPDLVRMKN